MAQPTKRKKLYFNVLLTRNGPAAPAKNAAFFVTQFTPGTTGDRYGNLLDKLGLLTPGSAGGPKARNAVSSWFQCSSITGDPGHVCLDYISANAPNITLAVAITDPILTRDFRVRLKAGLAVATNTYVLRGILYVQRQHSIEV